MLTLETRCAAETRALGARLAAQLCAGDVLLLQGPLGAGKSELTRGIAKGLGITEPVTSPTFTILQVHETGRLPLYHFDWYRLYSADELYEMGMDEYLGGDGVAVVEWPTQAPEAVPDCRLEIVLSPLSEEERRIELHPLGGFRSLSADALRGEEQQ